MHNIKYLLQGVHNYLSRSLSLSLSLSIYLSLSFYLSQSIYLYIYPLPYLDTVVAGGDPAVLDLDVGGRVGELALGVSAGTLTHGQTNSVYDAALMI